MSLDYLLGQQLMALMLDYLTADQGDEIAAKAVKEMIQDIVSGEDSSRPLSDKKIVELLSIRGLKIARRTVAKYRDHLGILNARMRKKF